MVEVVVDRGVGGGKLLQGLYGPELRHRSFSSSERLVGILGSVVEPTAALFHRRTVRPKPVCHNGLRLAIAFHRALQELQRSPTIPALCRKHFQHLAFVVHRSPKVMGLAIDLDEYPGASAIANMTDDECVVS